jgi:ABC-type nitrate/sulfonate/bicarbonate transport system ATPase subunit
LSAATAQRVSLATGLVHDPRLLLLDDPFLRLDPIARIALQAELVSLWQRCGFTALFATNDVDEALTIASRIIVLGRQPARSVMDLTLDCEFPRRLTETGLARTRRVLLQALENAGASATTRTFAPRRAVQSTRQGNPAPMVWPQDGLAAHVQERVSQTPFV